MRFFSSSTLLRFVLNPVARIDGRGEDRHARKEKKRKKREEQLRKGLRVEEHRESYVICRMENSKGKDEEAHPV